MEIAVKKEIEIKLKIEDINTIREKIISLGAVFIGKEKQVDEHFDFENNTLKEQHKTVRIRNKKIFCFKKGQHIKNNKKIHDEYEFQIDNYDPFILFLSEIGIKRTYIKEKIRESFKIEMTNTLLIEIDILPFGNFIEIEGEDKDIDLCAEKLSFKKKNFIIY